jgi:hypothetical protein
LKSLCKMGEMTHFLTHLQMVDPFIKWFSYSKMVDVVDVEGPPLPGRAQRHPAIGFVDLSWHKCINLSLRWSISWYVDVWFGWSLSPLWCINHNGIKTNGKVYGLND